MSVKVSPLSYVLGAEISGVNLADVSGADFEEIHRALLAHDGILLFRDQDITREDHIAFSRRFGELDKHDAVPMDRHPQYHELLLVSNDVVTPDGLVGNGKAIGQIWHSDLAPSLQPAMGSLLRAVEVPSVGGDTMFTNMYAAYETLSAGMKRLIADLHGVHHRDRKNVTAEWAAENRKRNPPVAQPVVRVHPETGRKALYIGEAVKSFEAMTEDESRPIIDQLIRHATRPQFVYRHRWKNGDVLMWDNRCTMHLALGDYDPARRRHLERTTIVGTPSGYVCEVL
jgi:taurine dioxygenase